MKLRLSLALMSSSLLLAGAGCFQSPSTENPNNAPVEVSQTPTSTNFNPEAVTSTTSDASTTASIPPVATSTVQVTTTKSNPIMKPVVCTADAKICPDGTTVGRTNSTNCEFAACPTPKPTPKPVSTGPKTYTMAEVQTANSASKCWSVINGNVYNLTSWINQHPGGSAAILSLCGHDGSASFNGQHGGQQRPANELSGFQIGVLKK